VRIGNCTRWNRDRKVAKEESEKTMKKGVGTLVQKMNGKERRGGEIYPLISLAKGVSG